MKAYIVMDPEGKPLGYPASWGAAAAYRAAHGKPSDEIVSINIDLASNCPEDDSPDPVHGLLEKMFDLGMGILRFKK